MKKSVKLLIIFLICIASSNLVLSKDYSPSNSLFSPFELDKVLQKLNSSKREKRNNFGYNDSRLWLSYEITQSQRGDFLVIKNPLYENIKVFVNNELIKSSMSFPFNSYELPIGTAKIIIQSKSALITNAEIEILNTNEFNQFNIIHSFIILFYLLSVFSLVIICGVLARKRRSELLKDYTWVLLFLHILSIGTLFLGPTINHYLSSIIARPLLFSIVCSEFFACYFSIKFLFNISGKHHTLNSYKKKLMISSLIGVMLSFIHQSSLNAIAAIIIVFMTLTFGCFATYRGSKTIHALKRYTAAWSSILIGVLCFASHYFGLLQSYNFRYLIFVGAIIELTIVASIIAQIMSQKEEGLKFMQFSLAGMISEDEIYNIVDNGKSLALNSTKKEVTVLITDIQGFSKISEEEDSDIFVKKLTKYNSILSKIVHAHHGTVNKTVGDSLVCYFGYSLTGDTTTTHANDAVDCAIQIQKALTHLYMEGDIKFPTRIGISGGIVSLGNINPQGGIDFTIIGDAVNMAKRYETACEAFHILVSKEVFNKIDKEKYSFDKKFIQIKHQASLVESIHLDPFHNCNKDHYDIKIVIKTILESSIKESEQSYSMKNSQLTYNIIEPIAANYEVLNISLCGMALKSKIRLSKGILFIGKINDQDIVVQVNRVQAIQDYYLLGVSYTNLTLKQKEEHLENLLQNNQSIKAA